MIRGLIEGFYGRPWTWDERMEMGRWCAAQGLTHYVYAPKDDAKHRDRWHDPYDVAELRGFEAMVARGGLVVGFGISPGLSIDHRSADDRVALHAKVDQVVELGIGLVVLLLDDLPVRPGDSATMGAEHAAVARTLRDHLGDRAELALVPTEYTGTEPTPYLEALAVGVPDDVVIAWTGRSVVNDHIAVADADRRSAALAGRRPLLWDNVPVNDAFMADRLFLGPLRGREPGLVDACAGYLANPMVQPRCSRPALASAAAFLRGDDPVEAWAAEVDLGGLRVFAEACDGEAPRALVDDLAASLAQPMAPGATDELAAWLEAAERCDAPGLEDEADAWITQVRAEARVGRRALAAIEAARPSLALDGHIVTVGGPDVDAATAAAFGVAATWPAVRRAPVTVMGVRAGFRPVLGQRPDGRWAMRREALEHDANAVDALVRLAFDVVAALPDDDAVTVVVDGAAHPTAPGAEVAVGPGEAVEVTCGALTVRITVP